MFFSYWISASALHKGAMKHVFFLKIYTLSFLLLFLHVARSLYYLEIDEAYVTVGEWVGGSSHLDQTLLHIGLT